MANIEFDVKVDDSGAVSANAKIKASNQSVEDSFQDVDAAAKKASEGIGAGSEKAAKRVKASSQQASAGMAQFSRSSGQAGIQIQQFVGQVQAGTQPLLAFSQQAADLGIVLGAPLVGAVVGIGAALAGILIPSLFDTEDKTEQLIEKLRELAETKILTKEQAALLAQEERKLIKEKEDLIKATKEEIAENERQLKNISNTIQRGQLGAKAYNNLQKSAKELNEEIVAFNATISTSNQEIDESRVKLDFYTAAVKGNVDQTKAQKEAIEDFITSIQAQADAIGKTERQIALKKAAQEGANATQLAEINAAYDAIEAEDARVKAMIESQRAEIKAQREAAAEKLKIERETEAERQKIKQEAESQSKARVSAVEQIKQDIMTEQQLMAQKFITDGEMLKEALNNNEITKAEYDAIERERVAQHQQALINIENSSVNARLDLQRKYENAVSSMRAAAIQNAGNLLDQFAGQSKIAAIASIAINKGLALAQNTQNTLVAQTRALAELGPIAGPPVAAKIGAYGKLNGALIAATGLAQAAGVGNGNTAVFSGGVSAVNTTTNTSAVASAPNRTFDIRGINPGDLYQGSQIYELLKALAGDGYDFNFIGG